MMNSFSIDNDKYKDNKLISFLQVFGIILVVMGHSFKSDNSIILNRIIYSFHMPLFVFISGYLFTNSAMKKISKHENNNFFGNNGFLLKKTLRLLVPYIIISSLIFIPKSFFNSMSIRPVNLSLYSYIEMIIIPGKNVIIYFWFLPTIFLISIISFFLWKYILKVLTLKIWVLSLLFFLLITYINPAKNISLFNISGVFHYFFYFLFGIFIYIYENKIFKIIFKDSKIVLLVLLVLITFHFFVILSSISSNYYSEIVNIIAIVGIIESILLGQLYVNCKFKFFNHLNGSTYSIYLFSWFPQVFIQFIILKYISIPWILAAIISTLSGIYIPFIIYRILNIIKTKNKTGKIISLTMGN